MLFGRKLKLSDPEAKDISTNVNCHSRKISNIIVIFGIVGGKNTCHLREQQKIKYENYNCPTTKDIVLIEEDRKPRSAWKIGIIGEPIQGKDDKVGGAIVRIPKYNFFSNTACKQAVSDRMYE